MMRRSQGSAVPPLRDRWAARWNQSREWMGLGMVFIPVGERLLSAYSEAGRHYHDARHVLACLRDFDAFPGSVGDNDAVELALWFHDAVYDPRAAPGENELKSGRLFLKEFQALAGELIDTGHVVRLIRATSHSAEPADGDEALLMDIDLGILGADAVRYDAYAADIRREYAHVDDADYRKGRASVLRGFLDRKAIYQTRHFRKLLEKPARENLRRELMALARCVKGDL